MKKVLVLMAMLSICWHVQAQQQTKIKVSEQLGIIVGFDYGAQQKSKEDNNKNEVIRDSNPVNHNAVITTSIAVSF